MDERMIEKGKGEPTRRYGGKKGKKETRNETTWNEKETKTKTLPLNNSVPPPLLLPRIAHGNLHRLRQISVEVRPVNPVQTPHFR